MKVRKVEDFVSEDMMNTPAGAIIAKATAKYRHADRVEATKEAAIAAAPKLSHRGGRWSDVDVDRAAWLIMLADYIGCGGQTIRHPAFSGLGKGRKQASDGPAYIGAEYQAMQEIFSGTVAIFRNEGDDHYMIVSSDIHGPGWGEDTVKCEDYDSLFPFSTTSCFHEYDLVEILGKEWAVIFVGELLKKAVDSSYKDGTIFHFRETTVEAIANFYNLVVKASRDIETSEGKESAE